MTASERWGVIPHYRPHSDVKSRMQVIPCPYCDRPIYAPNVVDGRPDWWVQHVDQIPTFVTEESPVIPVSSPYHTVVLKPLRFWYQGESQIWFVKR